jgi:phenylacetate-CoA ligase
MDELTVRVEARSEHTRATDREEMARQLATLVRHNIGVTVRAEVMAPAALERSVGKAKRLVDNRPRQ